MCIRDSAYVVRALHDEFLPPCFFHVVFHFNAERAVIPGICQTTIDFGTRIYNCLLYTSGTIETRIGEKSIPSENTTPEPVVLQKLFSEMMREMCIRDRSSIPKMPECRAFWENFVRSNDVALA